MEKMRTPARTLVVAAGAVLLFVGVLVLASTQPWKPAKKLLITSSLEKSRKYTSSTTRTCGT